MDGKIVTLGTVENKKGMWAVLQQVKVRFSVPYCTCVHSAAVHLASLAARHTQGIDYSLSDFLGFQPTPSGNNKLYHMTVYLSPGDYHHFHSPTQWGVRSWSHFAGQLLPVNALGVNLVPGLFAVNERVCCFGEWEHGFMSYSAVGAFGVGSVHLSWDSSCSTNQPDADDGFAQDKFYSEPVELAQGDDMGSFSFGSTIVMVFEAPADLQWAVGPGDKVRMGEALVRNLAPKSAVPPMACSMRRGRRQRLPLQRQLPMLVSSDESSDDEGAPKHHMKGGDEEMNPLACAHMHSPLLVGLPPKVLASSAGDEDCASVAKTIGELEVGAGGVQTARRRAASWMSEDAASVMSAATGNPPKTGLWRLRGGGPGEDARWPGEGAVGRGWGRSSVCSVLSSRSAMSRASSAVTGLEDNAAARLRLRARMTMGDLMGVPGSACSVASGRSRGSAYDQRKLVHSALAAQPLVSAAL